MSILDQDWQQTEEEEGDEALSLDHSARVAVVDITQGDHVRTLDIGHCEWILNSAANRLFSEVVQDTMLNGR